MARQTRATGFFGMEGKLRFIAVSKSVDESKGRIHVRPGERYKREEFLPQRHVGRIKEGRCKREAKMGSYLSLFSPRLCGENLHAQALAVISIATFVISSKARDLARLRFSSKQKISRFA
uniref:Uncharacterized protein n=1 Tax=Candidatus Kentrum sp. MB TaxID=2138164 RepID=A0A451BDU1_9GAMM|nr:MAG: hypothetical protein BECKMB1821G_GA0114241_105410 [Candidatus Kentron sp. MB]VFK34197.1 MAG: hypothetical protein BECKMB1821I_GA0114274_10643 [Candidatus Kentron sp. MB]VFK76453.1 MAG: hypothetical protein BECKMB1821H_GA0114242_105711 [Candidatus Kentron sp. MB]